MTNFLKQMRNECVAFPQKILFSLENYPNLWNIEYSTSELHIFKRFFFILLRYSMCLQIYLLLKKEEKREQLGNFKPSIAFEDSELPKLKTTSKNRAELWHFIDHCPSILQYTQMKSREILLNIHFLKGECQNYSKWCGTGIRWFGWFSCILFSFSRWLSWCYLFFIKMIVCRITVAWSFDWPDLGKKFITSLFVDQIEWGFQRWIVHEKLYK